MCYFKTVHIHITHIYMYIHVNIYTTWKVDGASAMYWFIMASYCLLIHLFGVAPSTFTTASININMTYIFMHPVYPASIIYTLYLYIYLCI